MHAFSARTAQLLTLGRELHLCMRAARVCMHVV